MATSAQTRPEPMNSSPHHSKVKVSMTLANPIYVAGKFVAGRMEVECRADIGLGIGVMMVELFALQGEHRFKAEEQSAQLAACRTHVSGSLGYIDGPGLPPSNAVQAYPQPGDPSYPLDYHQARRGVSTFLFRIPLPSSAPSSISFGSDLARVRYELRATVGVMWKGEKRLVVCKREIDVVESFEEDFSRPAPEGVVVGEHGKIWVQGSVVGIIVAGESAGVELQVKNHSNKKNTGLTLALTRTLVLPGIKGGEASPLQISDVLTTVPFRGPEYIIPPGAEGVASLVFDVPKYARGVRGGLLEGDGSEFRTSESLFEVRCMLVITINMGIGHKDIHLDIPVPIVHPAALPEPPEYNPYYSRDAPSPHIYPSAVNPISPPIIDAVQNQVWFPPALSHTPQIHDVHYFSPGTETQYYFLPPPHVHIPTYIPIRPVSAGSIPSEAFLPDSTGLDIRSVSPLASQNLIVPLGDTDPEEGKGERATRVTQHLRLSSRNRSVSPRSHRFPLPMPPPGVSQAPPTPSSSFVEQTRMAHLWNHHPSPLLLPTAPLPVAEPVVYSPRPFLSPKRSFDGALPKSERVEELERMAEEVEKTTIDLSSDLPKTTLEPTDAQCAIPLSTPQERQSAEPDININKTLPVPPPLTKKTKDKGKTKPSGRTRIDQLFVTAPMDAQAPPTPMAAVTPVKLPFKPKSAEFRAQLIPNGQGQAESGLDALEKRLLAEVGTRKMDLEPARRPAWSVVQPINIPSKDTVPDDPLNDSAISSLTLAGEWMGADRDEVEISHEAALELDVEHDHDSDEKTHKAGKSSASASSRKGSRGKGDKTKKKAKEINGEGENHGRKKKTAAAKGRVAAWLGGIDPQAPPMEEVLPPSPAVSRKLPPSMASREDLSGMGDGGILVNGPVTTVELTDREDGASVPNPRSSGFVPIEAFKSGILQRNLKSLPKDATVAREAKRVADLWSSSIPKPSSENSQLFPKHISSAFPSLAPAPPTAQSIRTERRVSPPSSAGAVDILGAKHYNIETRRSPHPNLHSPAKQKVAQPSPHAVSLLPSQDPEVIYDARSARGGRGGKVKAITSIWAAGGTDLNAKSTNDPLPVSKPKHHLDSAVKDIPASAIVPPVTPKLLSRAPIKSLLTTSAPPTLPPNPEPKHVEFAGKRPRPIVKSPSVPAIISSSHATPTLSSTASLARFAPVKSPIHTAQLPPTVSKAQFNIVRRVPEQATAVETTASSAKPGTGGGEMAFGQARLRDLIKKYQGHPI
ncbi:hypothetical protein C0991_012173 [Blastosporella zonata]|nr:hypothetical protein C0991_012173 [Blastosporella zonata]